MRILAHPMLLVQTIGRACACAIGLARTVRCSSDEGTQDDFSSTGEVIVCCSSDEEIQDDSPSAEGIIAYIRRTNGDMDDAFSQFKRLIRSRFTDTLLNRGDVDLEKYVASVIADLDKRSFSFSIAKEYRDGVLSLMVELGEIARCPGGMPFSETNKALANYYNCMVRILRRAMAKNSTELCDFWFPEFDGVLKSSASNFGKPIKPRSGAKATEAAPSEAKAFSAYHLEFMDIIAQWYRKHSTEVSKVAPGLEPLELELADIHRGMNLCEAEYTPEIERFRLLQEFTALMERVAALEAGRTPHVLESQSLSAAEGMTESMCVAGWGDSWYPEIPIMRRARLKREISRIRTEIFGIVGNGNIDITKHPDIYKPVQQKLDELFSQKVTLCMRVSSRENGDPDDVYRAERISAHGKLVRMLRGCMIEFVAHLRGRRTEHPPDIRELLIENKKLSEEYFAPKLKALGSILADLEGTCTSEILDWEQDSAMAIAAPGREGVTSPLFSPTSSQ